MGEKKEMLVKREEGSGLVNLQVSAQELLIRKEKIQEIQAKVMREGIDYGVIPGCFKPTLLKPGAETLNVTFRLRPVLDPERDIKEVDMVGGHKEFTVTVHILNEHGVEIATGVGSCSTMESKYRYRKAKQLCPACGNETIRKGSKQYGGGWFCSKKDGGCGAKFKEGAPEIEDQEMGRIEYDNPADYYNTCLKMAKKRALIDGTLNATGASHVFTQDVEDMEEEIIQDAEYREVAVNEKEVSEDTKLHSPNIGEKPSQKKEEIKHWKDGDYKKGTCQKCEKKDVWCHIEGGDCYACRH